MSTLLAAIVGLLILAADPIEDGSVTGFLGQKVCFQPFLQPLLL